MTKSNNGFNEIVYSQKTGHVIAACCKALHAWWIGKKIPNQDRDIDYVINLPLPHGKIDGLTMLSDDLIGKYFFHVRVKLEFCI